MVIMTQPRKQTRGRLPGNLEAESLQHIVFQSKSPASFIALLFEKMGGTLRQILCAVLCLLPPWFFVRMDVNTGTIPIEALSANLFNIIKRVLVRGGPLI